MSEDMTFMTNLKSKLITLASSLQEENLNHLSQTLKEVVDKIPEDLSEEEYQKRVDYTLQEKDYQDSLKNYLGDNKYRGEFTQSKVNRHIDILNKYNIRVFSTFGPQKTLLGSGTQGKVYLAEYAGQEVAVKVAESEKGYHAWNAVLSTVKNMKPELQKFFPKVYATFKDEEVFDGRKYIHSIIVMEKLEKLPIKMPQIDETPPLNDIPKHHLEEIGNFVHKRLPELLENSESLKIQDPKELFFAIMNYIQKNKSIFGLADKLTDDYQTSEAIEEWLIDTVLEAYDQFHFRLSEREAPLDVQEYAELKQALQQLWDLGKISYSDLHVDNIMYSTQRNVPVVIDVDYFDV